MECGCKMERSKPVGYGNLDMWQGGKLCSASPIGWYPAGTTKNESTNQ